MLSKLNIWKSSIYARLVITFLIVMIPIYFIGFNIYNWGISTVKTEISNAKLAQIKYYIDNLEKDIQRIKIQQSDCLLSDDMNILAINTEFMNDYDRNHLMLTLQQRLNTIKSSSVYIENAIAIIPSIKKSIAGVGSISDLKQEDLKMLKVKNNSTISQLIYINNKIYLNAMFPQNYSSNIQNPVYSILIGFSSAELKKSLIQFDFNEGSGAFLLNSQNKIVISLSQNAGLPKDIHRFIENKLKSSAEGKGSIRIRKERYLVIYKNSQYLGLTLCNYIPEAQMYDSLKKYQIWFWIFSIAAMVFIVIFSFSIYQFLQRPLKKLIKAFKRLEGGDLNFSIKHSYNDEFQYLYEHFNIMLQNLNTTIDQSFKQKIMIQHAELKQLQAQINPHFLYNSFFILYTMTRREEYEELEKFALQLGEYFEFITRNGSDEVTLEKEVTHAKTYCDIQEKRFSNRLKVEFGEVPYEYLDLKVPRLILQPIIENAFEHGLEKKQENGLLQIGFIVMAQKLYISIEDNGEEISELDIVEINKKIYSDGDEIEITGIVNIHRRIRLKFGTQSGISVSRGNTGGLKVVLEISLEMNEVD
jgi:two-component system, sensor histidine kinase YesM